MCFRKVGYVAEITARGAIERVFQRSGFKLFSYQCPYCLRWHLTKKAQPGWHAFPPPSIGIFDVRDSQGVVYPRVEVLDKGFSSHRLYCVTDGRTLGRVDRMIGRNYQWRISEPQT